jgi:hypothetical protein
MPLNPDAGFMEKTKRAYTRVIVLMKNKIFFLAMMSISCLYFVVTGI